MNSRDTLKSVIIKRSFRRGDFTLSSGEKSDVYFNLKPTMFDPLGSEVSGMLATRLYQEIRREQMEKQIFRFGDRHIVSGLAVGAVPLIALMCSTVGSNITGTFVRKEVKGHGTRETVEGLPLEETVAGSNVVVVEDVCTTGGAILRCTQTLRDAGAIVTDALCIVRRGGDDALRQAGIKLHHIFDQSEFTDE